MLSMMDPACLHHGPPAAHAVALRMRVWLHGLCARSRWFDLHPAAVDAKDCEGRIALHHAAQVLTVVSIVVSRCTHY
jgi:hypothetical protein